MDSLLKEQMAQPQLLSMMLFKMILLSQASCGNADLMSMITSVISVLSSHLLCSQFHKATQCWKTSREKLLYSQECCTLIQEIKKLEKMMLFHMQTEKAHKLGPKIINQEKSHSQDTHLKSLAQDKMVKSK